MKSEEKGLTAWQLTMMAVGTVIGGSFFLGSSVAIHAAGPSVILAYILGGVLVYFILFALSEMTVANPHHGSFQTFATETFGRGTGFVVGWVYWAGLALGMSSEATAVSILVRTWLPKIPISLMGTTIILAITLLNLLGADKLSKLESGLAGVKLLAIVSFIVIGLLVFLGVFPGSRTIGFSSVRGEAFMPGGLFSVAGSMLIVMFAYSGFEIIGLAASEARKPKETIPKSIRQTVSILVTLYIVSAVILLLLIPTSAVSENVSPLVAALDRNGIGWAGTALNVVLITAILSTMLASVFGLGRIFRSLSDAGFAPAILRDQGDVPIKGILVSGVAMLAGLGLGLLFPSVYLFLVSSGGFAILFTYSVIMATHIRFRRKKGCPPDGKCQMWGYPYSSWIVLSVLILSIISMPFVSGQASGLIAGIIMVTFFTVVYLILKAVGKHREQIQTRNIDHKTVSGLRTKYSAEESEDLFDPELRKEDHDKSSPEDQGHE